MRKNQIRVGGSYIVKVSGSLTTVTVLGENPLGGWDCRNEATGRSVRVRSAQRFRGEATESSPGERAAAIDRLRRRGEPNQGDLSPVTDEERSAPEPQSAAVIRATVRQEGIDALRSLLSHDAELLVIDNDGIGLISYSEHRALAGLLTDLRSPRSEVVIP